MPILCICLLCNQGFIGKGRDKPLQYVCSPCSDRYGNAAYGPACSFINQLRRARTAGVSAALTWPEWQQTCADFLNRCAYCEHRWGKIIEHYLPLDHYGGGTCVENCLPACQACNWRKGGRPPEKTTFSPVTMERLRRYLDWRRRGIKPTIEEIGDEWEWLLPPAWRKPLGGYTAYYGGLERVMRPGSLQENVLAKIHQAECLKQWIAQIPRDDPQYVQRLLGWAIASDEATRLVLRIEEKLSEETVHALQVRSEVNGQWETYRQSPSQLRGLLEQYIALP